MKKQSAHKSSKVNLPTGDFGQALALCEKFNLSSGARPGQRVQVVLSQALREIQPLVNAIKAGHRVEAGYHGGSWDILTLENGRPQALVQDRAAYRAGKVSVAVSDAGATTLRDIKQTFQLSHEGQAATLAVRIYARMLDNLWRGNHLSIWDKDNNRVPYEPDKLKAVAARPWNS